MHVFFFFLEYVPVRKKCLIIIFNLQTFPFMLLGIINKFLSLPFWVPLSKITYTVYLLNPVLIHTIFLLSDYTIFIDVAPIVSCNDINRIVSLSQKLLFQSRFILFLRFACFLDYSLLVSRVVFCYPWSQKCRPYW